MAPGKKFHGERRSALDMLTRSHERLAATMVDMARAAAKGDDEAFAEALAYLRGPALRHARDEEDSVFPRLRAAGHRALIERLTREHASHARATEDIAVAHESGDRIALKRLIAELAAEYREHSRIEEKELWPAIAALPAQELEAARREMQARRPKGGRGR